MIASGIKWDAVISVLPLCRWMAARYVAGHGLGDEHEDDAYAAAVEGAIQSSRKWPGVERGSFSAWAFKGARWALWRWRQQVGDPTSELTESDEPVYEPDDPIEARELNAALWLVASLSTSRVVWAFGLDGEPATVAQVGDALDVTRTRAKQIIDGGVMRMRHPKKLSILREVCPERVDAFVERERAAEAAAEAERAKCDAEMKERWVARCKRDGLSP